MRQLSKDDRHNIYTVKLNDVIIPPAAGGNNANEHQMIFDELFLVQDYFGMDL